MNIFLIDLLTDLLIELPIDLRKCRFEDNLTLEMLFHFYVSDGCHTVWGTESGSDLDYEMHGIIQYDVLYIVTLFLFC